MSPASYKFPIFLGSFYCVLCIVHVLLLETACYVLPHLQTCRNLEALGCVTIAIKAEAGTALSVLCMPVTTIGIADEVIINIFSNVDIVNGGMHLPSRADTYIPS